MTAVLRNPVLSPFRCLGDDCEDTCCQNWSMQLDEQTHSLYVREAPELLDAVEAAAETPWIMRKNPATGFCVKLEGGLCGIHRAQGDRFLGDACHFYPRVTRQLGDQILMTATLSCPEIARLSLFADRADAYESGQADRLPHSMKNYLPHGMSEADALAIHRAFVSAAGDDGVDAEQLYLRIACASRQMQALSQESWAILTGFYLQDADLRIPVADASPNDPFNLLHALCGLIVASRKPASPRLMHTIAAMETALASALDWNSVSITTSDASLPALARLRQQWQEEASILYTPVLRRWLGMQMALALHPFSGLGHTLTDRITLLGMRMALCKLALLSAHHVQGPLAQEHIVRIMQSLSRFIDHLGDPAFSLAIAAETGWTAEARMHGLIRFA